MSMITVFEALVRARKAERLSKTSRSVERAGPVLEPSKSTD